MANVFYRNPKHAYPEAVRGEGVYLFDAEGRQYLDGSGGAAVSCLGHAHPAVTAAIREQLDKVAFAHTAFFTNEPQEALATRLARLFGEPDARVYFVSGGSEANETAIKMARQYWLAMGRQDKHIVISRQQSYHGNTLGALSVTGHVKRREPYQLLLQEWPRIEPCYAYRHQRPDEDLDAYGQRSAAALERTILQYGPDRIAAFMAETVVGASLGAVTAAGAYFRHIREICDRYEVLLILDEVMAGCARTGSFFAFEQEDVTPDLVTLAKGLGAGYQPIGATLARGLVPRRSRKPWARSRMVIPTSDTPWPARPHSPSRAPSRNRAWCKGSRSSANSCRRSWKMCWANTPTSGKSAVAGCSVAWSWCGTGHRRLRSRRNSACPARSRTPPWPRV